MKLKPVILYRGEDFENEEKDAAFAAGFDIYSSRMVIEENSLVIARYSCLPFYKELETDLATKGCKLLNSHAQHRYIADLGNWYEDLHDYTAKTWRRPEDVPRNQQGSFIVKGETNSKKHLFKTHMFAKNRQDIIRVAVNLMDDGLISTQNLYVREFEEYATLGYDGITEMPITKEFRVFCAFGRILSIGYYWTSHKQDLIDQGVSEKEFDPAQVPQGFIYKVLDRIGTQACGVVIDVAQHKDGRWRVIELNDLQMSGLSENKAEVIYPNLMDAYKSATGLWALQVNTNRD